MHEDELDKNQLSVTAKLMESIVQKCSNIWLQKKRNHLFKELKEMVFKYNCQYKKYRVQFIENNGINSWLKKPTTQSIDIKVLYGSDNLIMPVLYLKTEILELNCIWDVFIAQNQYKARQLEKLIATFFANIVYYVVGYSNKAINIQFDSSIENFVNYPISKSELLRNLKAILFCFFGEASENIKVSSVDIKYVITCCRDFLLTKNLNEIVNMYREWTLHHISYIIANCDHNRYCFPTRKSPYDNIETKESICSLTEADIASIGILGEIYSIYETSVNHLSQSNVGAKHIANAEDYDLSSIIEGSTGLREVLKKVGNDNIIIHNDWMMCNSSVIDISKLGKTEVIKRSIPVSKYERLKNTTLLEPNKNEKQYTVSRRPFSSYIALVQYCIASWLFVRKQDDSYMDNVVNTEGKIIKRLLKDLQKIEEIYNQITVSIRNIARENRMFCKIEVSDTEINNNINDKLYVYENLFSIGCYLEKHRILRKKYCLANGKTGIIIAAHYCTVCNKYFIGYRTLEVIQSKYGITTINNNEVISIEDSSTESPYLNFKSESKLHQLGYNVVKGGLDAESRKKLLIHLIDSQKISYFEVSATIESSIRIFIKSPKHKEAVQKWRDDLSAINKHYGRE